LRVGGAVAFEPIACGLESAHDRRDANLAVYIEDETAESLPAGKDALYARSPNDL